jgi:hypothetical protein
MQRCSCLAAGATGPAGTQGRTVTLTTFHAVSLDVAPRDCRGIPPGAPSVTRRERPRPAASAGRPFGRAAAGSAPRAGTGQDEVLGASGQDAAAAVRPRLLSRPGARRLPALPVRERCDVYAGCHFEDQEEGDPARREKAVPLLQRHRGTYDRQDRETGQAAWTQLLALDGPAPADGNLASYGSGCWPPPAGWPAAAAACGSASTRHGPGHPGHRRVPPPGQPQPRLRTAIPPRRHRRTANQDPCSPAARIDGRASRPARRSVIRRRPTGSGQQPPITKDRG